jgi:hypothetical protein
LFAKEPEVAREFAAATPKGARLPEHVGKMSDAERQRMDAGHLAERPNYYIELNRMLDVPMHARMSADEKRRASNALEAKGWGGQAADDAVGRMSAEETNRRRSLRSSLTRQGYTGQRLDDLVEQMVGRMGAGPFIGPKGGLWADAQHTVAYDPAKHGKITPANCPSCKGLGHIIRRQAHMFGGEEHVTSGVCRTCNANGKHALDVGKVRAMGLPVPDSHQPKGAGGSGGEQKPRASQLSLLSYRKPGEQQSLLRSMTFVIPAGLLKSGGPFIGPKGGKWADAQHTRAWSAENAHLKIRRIVEIKDTRERELVEGTMGREYSRPIPGSGVSSVCKRCGKEHEVHATVELTDGSHHVMGTGCAKKQDPEAASRIGTLERAAKALGKATHELATTRQEQAALEAKRERAYEIVDVLTPPPITEITAPDELWARANIARGQKWLAMGPGRAWQQADSEISGSRRPEAVRDVTFQWKQAMLAEHGYGRAEASAELRLKHDAARLESQVRKLTAVRDAAVREGIEKAMPMSFVIPLSLTKAAAPGPFIGPNGGKYADAAHTQPWRSPKEHRAARKAGDAAYEATSRAFASDSPEDHDAAARAHENAANHQHYVGLRHAAVMHDKKQEQHEKRAADRRSGVARHEPGRTEFAKAFGQKGAEKPGHLWKTRKPDGKGGFIYTYADGSTNAHGNGPDAKPVAQPGQTPPPAQAGPPTITPPGAEPPPAANPPGPGGQPPKAGGGGKELPDADAIGAAGKKIVDAVRAQSPELAAQLEAALNVVVTGMKLRQAGQQSPAGDHKIHEGLKAFGRAFNQAAAPQSILGEEMGGLLEAHEKTQKRKMAEAGAEHGQAVQGAKDALGQVSGALGGQADPAAAQRAQAMQAGAAPGPSTGPTAPGQQDASVATDPNAPGPLDLQAPPATNGQAPQADNEGEVDALGLGNADAFNARFGHDPKAAAVKQANAAALAKLGAADQAPGAAPSPGAPQSETEQALADVHAQEPALDQAAQRRQQDVQQRGNFERELNTAKAKRDATEQQASRDGDLWHAREVARGNLEGGPPQAPAPQATPEQRQAGTVAPGKRKKGKPMQAALERALASSPIPVILLSDLVKGSSGPVGAAGPTGGAAPVTSTPPMPDYQSIFRQPPDDENRQREAEALANRRKADADRASGNFGFLGGTVAIPLDPTLYYVPTLRPSIMGEEATPGDREPMLTADQVLDRYKAGSEAATHGGSKDGSPVNAQTDAGRVPRSADRDNDLLAPQTLRPRPRLLDDRAQVEVDGATDRTQRERGIPARPVEMDDQELGDGADGEDDDEVGTPDDGSDDEEEDDEEEEEPTRFAFKDPSVSKSLFYIPLDEDSLQKSMEALYKAAGGHKYIRRVPTGNPKRPWRYFYRESSIARDATSGEEVKLDHERTVHVLDVGSDGVIHMEINGERKSVKPDEWASMLAGTYGEKFHAWAEKRAEQSVNAVLKHVPIEMLHDLPGDTDEERFEALQKRVPAVYAKLQKAFNRAGVNPWRAKEILAHALERRGWEPEARAAVVGSVLTKRTDQRSFHEIVAAAENVAGGQHVTAAHVGTVVEMRRSGSAEDDFSARVATIARNAERELAALSALLAKARGGGNESFSAEALATALSSTAIQQLNMLTTAFPGLRDRVAEQARDAMVEVASVIPSPEPKRIGGETHVYVAGDNGQPKAVRARYRLMEAGEIIASHDPLKSFRKREDYPENIQERAYHRDQAEQGKVVRNAQALNPAFVANTNPDAVNGPPVVMSHGDGVIALGGNSRTMSMQVAYEKHEEKGRALATYLAEHAHEFGFRPEDVGALERPVLVREIDPEDRSADAQRLLVRQLNESFTQAMDPRTMQVALGRKLDDQTLGSLGNDMQGDETLANFLGSPRSERFVNALMRNGIIDQRNSSQYLKKGTKLLNEDGRVLVERILVGRLVGDADILSNTGPKLVGNIASSVPYMVQAKAYGAGYDVGSDLAVALSAYNSLQNRVESGAIGAMDPKMPDAQFKRLFNYFDDLFGDRHPVAGNESATALLELLIRKPGPQQQAAVWRDYVKRAGQNPEGQSSMFGESKSPGDVLRATITAALKGGEDTQQRSMFG